MLFYANPSVTELEYFIPPVVVLIGVYTSFLFNKSVWLK